MGFYAERVVDIAEGEVGVREWGGANRGGSEKYQRPWGSWMVGQPWCGAFVSWCWTRAGMDGMHLASPSTQTMCNIARARGLVCTPRPGSAFVICSVHTGLIAYAMGGGVFKTIEGNSGDAVRFRQRTLGGMVIYAPPEISKGTTAVPEATITWYYLEDPSMRGVREWGGWSSKAARNQALAKSERDLKKQLRPFKREFPNPKAPYFYEDPSKPERYYGGWRSKAARDLARKRLQRSLGHALRPFSTKRRAESGKADSSLGKVD